MEQERANIKMLLRQFCHLHCDTKAISMKIQFITSEMEKSFVWNISRSKRENPFPRLFASCTQNNTIIRKSASRSMHVFNKSEYERLRYQFPRVQFKLELTRCLLRRMFKYTYSRTAWRAENGCGGVRREREEVSWNLNIDLELCNWLSSFTFAYSLKPEIDL